MPTVVTNRKIVHLTSAHSPFDIRIFHRECKSLAAAGYEVVLIAPHPCNEDRHGIGIRGFQRKGRLARFTLSEWQILKKALSERADVYHFHDPDLVFVGLILRALGKNVIYDAHESLPKDILSKHYLPRGLRPVVANVAGSVELWAGRWFSGIVSATPAIASRLARINKNTITAQNFPTVHEFSSSHSADRRRPLLAYAGGLAARRGIAEMVRAIGMLSAGREAILELAGEFETPSDYRIVESLPGWSRVRLRGILKREEVRELLNTASIGLVLYQPLPNHYEAGPHKLFEYMAAGIPMIASDFPLWRRIIEEAKCGILVDPTQPAAIAEAIEYLLSHPDEAARMGECGRNAFQRRYNWEGEEKKLLELYASILEGSAMPACTRDEEAAA